jgi:hypothetical protein
LHQLDRDGIAQGFDRTDFAGIGAVQQRIQGARVQQN